LWLSKIDRQKAIRGIAVIVLPSFVIEYSATAAASSVAFTISFAFFKLSEKASIICARLVASGPGGKFGNSTLSG
jgi:hypothetical protein